MFTFYAKLFSKAIAAIFISFHFISFSPAIDEGSNFFTAWSTLVIVHLVDYSHPSGTDRF